MIGEVIERITKEDPVRGRWAVCNTTKGTVWCDASSIALGVVLEIDTVEVEDAAWLRKKDDFNHINVAELEAVVKGVNLAVKWGLSEITVVTDSATVYSWINLSLTEERRIKSKGAAEILVKRRLGVLKNLVEELNLTIEVILVSSQKNKADKMTRVKKAWIEMEKVGCKQSFCAVGLSVQEGHKMHHMGVERTLFLARKIDPGVTKDTVKRVVRDCIECQSIDPAPVVHQGGSLGVACNWRRIAIDVTHYKNVPYLSIMDCGPGRFAIWRRLSHETAECILTILEGVFFERGPVDEILMDNATAFRSHIFQDFLSKWNVHPFYRAAYRASGNGIVERHHRTVKAIAEKGKLDPIEAVFWYNMSPRSGQDENSVPHKAIFSYEWRHPAMKVELEDESADTRVAVGDEVWVKPPMARCTDRWNRGIITSVNSNNNVSVDGMPRHILDVRQVRDNGGLEGQNNEGSPPTERQRSLREKRSPSWMTDYQL